MLLNFYLFETINLFILSPSLFTNLVLTCFEIAFHFVLVRFALVAFFDSAQHYDWCCYLFCSSQVAMSLVMAVPMHLYIHYDSVTSSCTAF